jgi:hypothetical protein
MLEIMLVINYAYWGQFGLQRQYLLVALQGLPA